MNLAFQIVGRSSGCPITWDNGLVVKVLDSQHINSCSKPMGGSKVDSAFHPSEVGKMSTRNFWELSGKKQTASLKWLELLGS